MKGSKIFFQTSRDLLDPYISEMIHHRLTDGWIYKHYRDADIIQFFMDHPDKEFPDILHFFYRLKRGEHKADLFRYYHIYKIGGFFMDSDAMIYESMDRIVKDYTFVSVLSTMVSDSLFQGILGAEPGHPVIYQALKSFYTMDINILDSNYHYLCKEIYKIYNSYEGDKGRLYLETGNGKRIIDQGDTTLLFKHFWDNKEGIPNTLVQQNAYDTFIKHSSSDVSNLVYFCVFYNPDYFKLLELLLKTMRFFSKTESFDILVVTNKDFEPLVQELSVKLNLSLKIFCIDFTTIFQAACARLYIFDYENINKYTKILYLDTDIIIKKDITPVFNIDLEGRLYGIESGTIRSPSFGCQFFDYSKISPDTPGLNSGTLLFKNCQVIRDLFLRIQNHIIEHTKAGIQIPYCMDQPFINYHAIKDGLYNNVYMNQYVSLYEDNEIPTNSEISSICHFSYPIGNFGHKYDRMKNFVVDILHKGLPDQDLPEVLGKSYSWGKGYIKFMVNFLETTWGNGIYYIIDAETRRVHVSWNGYYHILQFNPDLTSFTCIRVGPRDFEMIDAPLIKKNHNLYIYGDSHAYSSFKNLTIPHLQLFQYGVTMNRIARDKVIVNFHETQVSSEHIYCLAYGEIDVRCHIGKQVLLVREENDICMTLVNGYFETIQKQIPLYKAIIIVGILCPTDPLDHTHENAHPHGPLAFVGTNEERVRYTKKMNALLEEGCLKYGYIYFNPYDFYTRDDGCLSYGFSDGCIHLGKNSYFLDEFTLLYNSLT